MSDPRLGDAVGSQDAASKACAARGWGALLRGITLTFHPRRLPRPANQDVDRMLTVLLADLSERQREIHARLDQESRSHLTFITVLVGTIGVIIAADQWVTSLSPGLQTFVPSMALLLAIILLFLPIDSMHQQLNFRVLALYITRQIVPQIRDLVEQGPSHRLEGAAQLQLMTWETFRSEKVLKVRFSNILMNATMTLRALSLYVPAALSFAFYFVATDGSSFPKVEVLEAILLLFFAVGILIPFALFVQLMGSKELRLRSSEEQRSGF